VAHGIQKASPLGSVTALYKASRPLLDRQLHSGAIESLCFFGYRLLVYD
jgi:hypothetical protein